MAELKDIWFSDDGQELRIDWNNDRHHSIKFDSDAPLDVAKCFLAAAALIESEEKAKKI